MPDLPSVSIDKWKTYFKGILCPQKGDNDNQDGLDTIVSDNEVSVEELDSEINLAEIQQAHLKNGKARGLDGILGEFLKAPQHVIALFLTKLFNSVFDNGQFPAEWTKSVIVPLHKKGDINNPENYRGISLLSIISKLFTSILNKRFYNWAENENKICEEQAGFREGYSTVDHIFTLVTMIKSSL